MTKTKRNILWETATLFLFFILLGAVGVGGSPTDEEVENEELDVMTDAMVDDLKGKCDMTDEKIAAEGLNKQEIRKVRKFCSLSKNEMKKAIKGKLKRINWGNRGSVVLGYTNSYSCWTWYGGYNWGIPNYGDLGLSSSTCIWHDDNPSCKVEGSVACLWGCTNKDPNLGWHEKNFANQSALETEIYNKGYHRTAGYAAGQLGDYADADYTRGISYGYRYQVNWYKTIKKAHSEGPEANPESNWYGFIHDYWPEEVFDWHLNC